MNSRTFKKLSEHILSDFDDNKQNLMTINHQNSYHKNVRQQYTNMSIDQIISMKKINALKVKQINASKDHQIQTLKARFEKQKKQLIQKYEKIISDKQQYIQMLQELCSNSQNISQEICCLNKQKKEYKVQRQTRNVNIKSDQQPAYYFHQIPLYNELCYSIQRPMVVGKQNNRKSSFCSTQKIKNRLTSNQKSGHRNSIQSESNSKYRSQSSTRNSNSKHTLMPSCAPKYFKIL